MNLVIGEGTAATGVFSEIDWSLGSYYLGIELDTGSGYVAMGTTQLLSVPYALYAASSGNAIATIPNLETVLAENNSANNQQIKNLLDPTEAQDAATKSYVDALIASLQGQIDDFDTANETGIVTDIDGNTYDYLTYGEQVWTVDNAEMVTYRDGTPIPQVTDATEWANLNTGAWCYYENDPSNGKIYNWYAIAGIHDNDETTPNKELAPEGWHVSSDAEWTTLENYLINNGYNYDETTTENKIAKSMASNSGWATSTNTGVPGNNLILNNSSGFNAFPLGFRGESYGLWRNSGLTAVFCSSTDFDLNSSFNRFLHTDNINLFFNEYNDATISYSSKQNGMSVRFVKDDDNDPSDIDDDNDGYSENQGDCDDANAQVYPNAIELDDNIDNDCDGEIDEGFNQSGTVTDIDGNTYDYLTYGNQVWTVENANMVTYRDGTPIPEVTDNTTWKYLTTGAWSYYNNDPTKPRLYNWYAVMGIHDTDPNTPNKEFAPEGWHVPTDAEWTTLEDYLIANGYNYDSTTTGNKIGKAIASTTGWNITANVGAIGNDQSSNNSSGFNAFPEGGREPFQGEFIYIGQIASANFWSSTENGPSFAWSRLMEDLNINLSSVPNTDKAYGFSVRFVNDIDSSDIDDDNDGYSENQGDCDDANAQVYPNAIELDDNIDNDCDGEIDEGFNQSVTVTDIDGNTYDYFSYGNQFWTVENAEMITYRDGTPIPQVTDGTDWSNLTTGAWSYYNNDPTKPRLYNWYAVMGIHDTDPNTPNKEFAPEGWHVPTDAEWTTLEDYLIANGYNYDGSTTGNKIGKAMASKTGWNISVNVGAIGNDQSSNNSSGFNAFPEGFRISDGEFLAEGGQAIFWSSTESNTYNAWNRILSTSYSNLNRASYDASGMEKGYSVRFVRD